MAEPIASVGRHAGAVRVRPRLPEDLAPCGALVRAVRHRDGYPPYLPGGDVQALLEVPGALGAWVAELDGAVVGHVALHRESSPEVMARAAGALGLVPGDLAVVARLVVAPPWRRGGIGRALLETAASAATRFTRRAVLDVAARFGGAVTLYRSCRWIELGTVAVRLPDGTVLDELVFASPPAGAP
ncbi:MAG TPA: GNAT family N-acetyltransferase [Acidimicrobiales bacterium]|nr:GNAT family N-acetyltransferase [Acidimicrobiales bacterium]